MVTFAQARPSIFAGESGGDYNALFGYQNREGGRFANTRLTDMTIEDVMRFTDPRGPYAEYVRGQVGRTATPVGAYQVVGTTLRDAVDALGLDPSTQFTPETQDRIGEWIFSTQGTGAWEGYRGPQAGGQGMEPQMMQPQGLLQQQPQSQTDPFEGLSRSQRMMLGFGALRDAAASLQGQQSNYFGNTLGQFEQARERERLRRQGMMQALPELQRNLAMAQMMGQDTRPFEAAIRSVYADLGIDQLPAGQMGVAGGMAAPTADGATVTPASADGGAMDVEMLQRQLADLRRRADTEAYATGRVSEVTAGSIRDLEAQIAAVPEREAAIIEAEDRTRDLEYSANLLRDIIEDPNLSGVTGRWRGAVDPNSLLSGLAYDEGEFDLMNKIQQLQGEQFLNAFQSLKGGGQITEMEGRIATQAESRIGGRRTSAENYQQALREILQVTENNIVRERNAATGRNDPIPHPVIGGYDVTASADTFDESGSSSSAPQVSGDGWTTFGDIRIRPVE